MIRKFLFLIFATSLIAGGLFYGFNFFINYRAPESVTLYFEPGTSLKSISRQLAQKQVIPNAFFFEYMARLEKKGNQLKAGEYEFPAGAKPIHILELMIAGRVKLYTITIPEGWNLRQIAALLAEKSFAIPSENSDLLKPLGVEAASLEGYLFPETYTYDRSATGKKLIQDMVKMFRKKVTPELVALAQRQGLTLHQWVTLASIVEKETAQTSERPLIASVFLNRLKIGMPLQTDPTVIYGIKNFNGNLTRNDLATNTPYNTYTNPGLPPGPICSPGLDALNAVLNPIPTQYLYFVAKGDGTHYFSSSLEEHNQAVRTYQLH